MKKCMSVRMATCVLLCCWCTHVRGDVPLYFPTHDELLNAAASNTLCAVHIVVQDSPRVGSFNTCGMSTNNVLFYSFTEYQSFVAKHGLRLFNLLGNIGSTHDVRFKVTTTCSDAYDSSTTSTRFVTDINVGTRPQIGPGSFNVMPTVVQPITLTLPGLAYASISHGEGVPMPITITNRETIVLNDSLSQENSRTRVFLTFTNGESAIYTQRGVQLLPPELLLIINSSDMYNPQSLSLNVHASSGADTIIETSTNVADGWTVVGSIPWDSEGQDFWLYVPVEANSVGLFRARSY